MVKNFVIPLVKDELLTSHANQYFVEEIIPLRMISEAIDVTRTALQTKGAHFILDHFDTFFSIIVHGNKTEIEVCLRSFNRIYKAVELLSNELENIFDRGQDIEEEDRETYLCINKMLAYLFSWFICHIDEQITKNANEANIGKRKKNKKTDIEGDWEQQRQRSVELLYRWLQIPLHKIWKPPIVEDSFVTVLAQICYKILEQSRDANQKHIRQTIFEILGTLIKRYNHGITCVVRIIQLVKLCDALAMPIAVGVVHMTTECGCNGLIKEVINEIGQSDFSETDSRNISTFLESIATSQSNLIIPIFDEIVDYLSNDFYTMRNCVIGVLGALIQKTLTGENLTEEQKEQRDECLNNLEDHILDCNAYVRSKVLHTWQQLCCEGAIPLARYGQLIAATALRLEDKSANVRKQALQLLRTLLQSNPFAGKLNCVELSASLKNEKAKLQNLQSQIVNISAPGHAERFELWNTLLEDIKIAIKEVVENSEMEHVTECQENIDPDYAFEHVRQQLLNRNVIGAVTYLWKVCEKLEAAPKMENLSVNVKKECLFAFLLKIFMESEGESRNNNGNINATEKLDKDNKQEEISKRKRVINYLKNCLTFATELEKAIPVAEKLLFSTCAGDAVESCTFLGTAFQFGVTGAANAVRNSLFQVFHRDQSVRNNIATVYKEIYLDNDNDKRSNRQNAIVRANHLIDLLKELQPGQSPALAQLIAAWYRNEELSNELLQVLWEKFSMKYPGTLSIDSRAALMIITMISQTESNIVIDNLDVLIKIGLGPRSREDLLLARDTCRILLNIKDDSKNFEKYPLRYPNDHDMFQEILTLLIDNFTASENNAYISFVTDAINVIYHLTNQPNNLIKKLLLAITEKYPFINKEDQTESIDQAVLSKMLYIIGHIAIRQMVYLDMSVYKELKRRNTIREMKGKIRKRITRDTALLSSSVSNSCSARQTFRRNDSTQASIMQEDNGEEALEGAVHDAEVEFINDILENEIVTGNGLLARFVPLVLSVCQHPEKYADENLQAAGSLALSKMMTVSSEFCEQSLQLLVTILERSPYPGIRSNMLIGLSDLTTRFPNQVEPWSKHIYGRLRDTDVNVRRTCVRMLSNLIMREMIRVKGQVSELVLCIIDEDEQIRQDTKEFFNQLAQKGNALYNVVPDILSRLSDPQSNLEEKQFQDTIKYILGLMQKERHIDTIIEKICTRFKLADTERQWRDLSYCLSLLQFNEKSIRRLTESLPLLKDKIHHNPVLMALQNIIEQTKKKANAKDACIELEEKVQELLDAATNSEDSRIMPPPPVPKKKRIVRRSRRKSSSDEENSDSDDSDSNNSEENVNVSKSKTPKNKNIHHTNDVEENDDDEDDMGNVSNSKISVQGKKRLHTRKTNLNESQNSNSDTISPSPKRNKTNKEVTIRTSPRLPRSRK